MKDGGRLAEGVAWGACGALGFVAVLMIAVQDLEASESIPLALIGAAATLAAAGIAVRGIGWQIRHGQDAQEAARKADEHARLVNLKVERMTLIFTLSQLSTAVEATKDRLLDHESDDIGEADFAIQISKIEACLPNLGATARYASEEDSLAFHQLVRDLQLFCARLETAAEPASRGNSIIEAIALIEFIGDFFPYARFETNQLSILIEARRNQPIPLGDRQRILQLIENGQIRLFGEATPETILAIERDGTLRELNELREFHAAPTTERPLT